MNTENNWRERIAMHGQSLYQRGLAPGSSGNISVRLNDGFLVTPTNSCLGRLEPGRISKINFDGVHIDGDKPSKEAFLHLLMYRQRPQDHSVVHLHSPYSVAASCCADVDKDDVLPAITAYYMMKIGKLPLIPYFKPGDKALAEAVEKVADKRHAVLLANHGPVVAGKSLDNAVYAMEELEETAKLYFLLQNHKTRFLSADQIDELIEVFPS